jgi:catechol 2,3-dioxygenase-like lactoylglutathione lyase family enzyme
MTNAEDWREDELSGLAKRSYSMHPTGVVANLSVADLAEARDFYADFLGLSVEGFNLGWVVNLQSPDGRAVVQLVTRDATAPVDSVISVHVGNEVEAAYEEAQRRGLEIVHPLTAEPWGVRRFFVRAPDGNVVNVVDHKDEDA